MASKVITVNAEAALGFQAALSLKSPKGKQEVMHDSIDARRLLVSQWIIFRPSDENPEAGRFEPVPGYKDRVQEVTLEGSTYNYAKDALVAAMESGKLHDLQAIRIKAAFDALEAAKDADK